VSVTSTNIREIDCCRPSSARPRLWCCCSRGLRISFEVCVLVPPRALFLIIHFRSSEDPRVVLEGTNSKLSSGWEWFRQVRDRRSDMTLAPTLYDLQLIFVSQSLRPFPVCTHRISPRSFPLRICRVRLPQSRVGHWSPSACGKRKRLVCTCADASTARWPSRRSF
jgi:hypothetical protein